MVPKELYYHEVAYVRSLEARAEKAEAELAELENEIFYGADDWKARAEKAEAALRNVMASLERDRALKEQGQ